MNYTPADVPSDPKALPEYLRRELQRIANVVHEQAERLWFMRGILTPAQITASQNNYAPSGLESANVLRLSANGPVNITGLRNPQSGTSRAMVLLNVDAATITLVDASASSDAANRFEFNANRALAAAQACIIWYDIVSARWRELS